MAVANLAALRRDYLQSLENYRATQPAIALANRLIDDDKAIKGGPFAFDSGGPQPTIDAVVRDAPKMARAFKALHQAVVEYVLQHSLEHDDECPEDDTCACPLVQAIETALAGAESVR
jgi:hypothetical protein